MGMRHILLVFGTRPEAIKMAPVIRELRRYPEEFETIVCVTGQHRQMLHQVLRLFDIEPDYNLDIMRPRQSLTEITCRVLEGVGAILTKARPDWVLVQGDTTTCMAAALAGAYAGTRVAHVEAGLRTWDKGSPFPEEINRQVTSVLCDRHFAPTQGSRANLLREGVGDDRIFVTGNTVIDALLEVAGRLRKDEALRVEMRKRYSFLRDEKRLVLITGHRRESFGEGFRRICGALRHLALTHDDVEFVYPVHMNPNVSEPVQEILGGINSVHLIEPQDYLPFVYLMDRAFLILTDSGGVQEEAPSLGTPVLVLRDTTERPEAIEAGTVRLVGTDQESIISETTRLLMNRGAWEKMSCAHNPYGDGHAAERIVMNLRNAPEPTQ